MKMVSCRAAFRSIACCAALAAPAAAQCTLEWVELPVPGGLEARAGAAMARSYDTDELLLFGGINSAGTLLNDTWVYDGWTWSEPFVGLPPSPRLGHAISYDDARDRFVVYGGMTDVVNGFVSDSTYYFQGGAWNITTGQLDGLGRWRHVMAYDPIGERTLLHGGVRSLFGPGLGATWARYDTGWALMAVTGPSSLARSAMCTDRGRGVVSLFGGGIQGTSYTNGLFEWNGSDWFQRTPAAGPTPAGRNRHVMAYDELRQFSVVAGGFTGAGRTVETWSWNGIFWERRDDLLLGVEQAVAAYSDARRGVVILGGIAGTGYTNRMFVLTDAPIVTTNPTPLTRNQGQNATFTVAATHGVLGYSWFRDNTQTQVLNGATGTGSTISGATTASITITNAQPTDAGSYICAVTGCNTAFAKGALLTVVPTFIGCDSVDFNNDGVTPDLQDILDFLDVFSGRPCSSAFGCNDIDFNNDGVYPDTTDLLTMLNVFSGGSCW